MASLFGKNRLHELAQKINTEDIRDKLALIQTWHDDYHNGSLKHDKETSREQAYNNALFIKVLGYEEKPAVPYSFEPKATTDKGQLPDAVVSWTDTKRDIKNISAVVELKGAGIDLDRPQRREGNMSPVQQGFKYKTQYRNCPFVIVSNFYEFRLYQDNQLDFERWTLDDLISPQDDYIAFKTFYVLLCRENFTGPDGTSKTQRLLSDIRIEQEEIGKKFYKVYKEARLKLLRDVYANNPHTRAHFGLAIEKAQKIIDRVVFACFAEDRGLLPDNTMHRVVLTSENSSLGLSLWIVLRGLFDGIDRGSDKLEIPLGYNGGLFKEDKVLNSLKVSDDALRPLIELSRYDFQEELSVTILGHIFEQSISDLEEIKAKAEQRQGVEEMVKSRRKKEGIFYTPDYIVRYIVDSSLGKYLSAREEELKAEFKLHGDITDATYERREKQAYLKYYEFLKDVKVVDPACGSGAFLVHVFDYLLAENIRVGKILGLDKGVVSFDEVYKNILQKNIFGVDLNEESVEITKLSLWLKSAQKGKKLTSLDNNIKCGNSLINNEIVAGIKAFEWENEFSDILKSGGFDVVVMNPPYVDSEEMAKSIPEQRDYLTKTYTTTRGNWDLYIPFIELAQELLKDGGYASFITPDKWISKPFGAAAREKILPHCIEVTSAGREVFEDANVDSIITTISQKTQNLLTAKVVEGDYFNDVNVADKATIVPPYTLDHLFSSNLNLLSKIEKASHKLIEIAECENACATSDAYKIKPLIVNDTNPRADRLKMINTGTIDRYVSKWGSGNMTYLGDKYLCPTVEKGRFEEEFGNSYYRKSLRPKIIIKGLTLLDACIDTNGDTIPGKSTLVICSENLNDLTFLLGFVNSKLPLFYIKHKYSAASYNGGINFTKDMVNNLPLPEASSEVISMVVASTNKLIELTTLRAKAADKFRILISSEFGIEEWPSRLKNWWRLDFQAFAKALPKLPLRQKDDLLEFFETYQQELRSIESEIQAQEAKINQTLYVLYGLDHNDIATIEGVGNENQARQDTELQVS